MLDGAVRGPLVLLALVLACGWGSGAEASETTGHIAVWHHRRPAAKTVNLPPFTGGRYLADALVQVGPLPDNLVPDQDNCLCFDVNDDRLAFVHTFYYAHMAIADYNAILREQHLPQLRDVTITLTKDSQSPTSAISRRKRRPFIHLRFSAPAIDPFTIVREVGRLLDLTLSPRHKQKNVGPEPYQSFGQLADEAAVEEGAANILAALELGTTGSLPFTSDTLDSAPADDVDSFVRFPDLMISRREVLKGLTEAPRFAARYAPYVAKLQRTLDDPSQRDWLAQPDEHASSAIINQPLWQAAVRFGFRPAKILVLRTLAAWSAAEVGTMSFGRELVTQAQIMGPKWATFLSDEYQRRGLTVPDAHLEMRPN